MAAPVVHTLEDIIKQIQTAYKPQQDFLDSTIAQNDTSGTAQVQGLDAAKAQAFNGIAQAATNKGMTFSGFTPNEQATYTGSTYLPALARLQQSIADTRNSLLGKKADLVTQGNAQALDVQRGEQQALDAYNAEQEKIRLQLEAEARQREFQAQQAALDRGVRLATSGGGGGGLTAYQAAQLQQKNADFIAKNFKMAPKGGNAANGMSYTGPGGQPISAYAYAQATGQDFGTVLAQDPTKYAQNARAVLAIAQSGDWSQLNKMGFVQQGFKSPPASARNNPDALAGWLKSNFGALF